MQLPLVSGGHFCLWILLAPSLPCRSFQELHRKRRIMIFLALIDSGLGQFWKSKQTKIVLMTKPVWWQWAAIWNRIFLAMGKSWAHKCICFAIQIYMQKYKMVFFFTASSMLLCQESEVLRIWKSTNLKKPRPAKQWMSFLKRSFKFRNKTMKII